MKNLSAQEKREKKLNVERDRNIDPHVVNPIRFESLL